MIKLAYRTHYGDISSLWRDISYEASETMGEDVRVEYAYAAPVVTDKMVKRGAIGMCSSQLGWEGLFIDEQEQHLFNSRKCLAAALESPDV
jgi:hypothetical protein